MKTQVVLIHGGTTFKSRKDYLEFLKNRKVRIDKIKKWSDDYLEKKLGRKFKVIRLKMPLKEDAKYDDWKITFERYLPYFEDNLILIGSSLGGIFLAKYLSENNFPKKILSVYLIGAPYDNTIEREDLVGGFKLKSHLNLLEKNTKNLYLFFSEDDEIIPLSHAEKYKNKLKNAKILIFKNKKGHFKISKFPEIIKMIKNDLKHKK